MASAKQKIIDSAYFCVEEVGNGSMEKGFKIHRPQLFLSDSVNEQ